MAIPHRWTYAQLWRVVRTLKQASDAERDDYERERDEASAGRGAPSYSGHTPGKRDVPIKQALRELAGRVPAVPYPNRG